jgi:hypothetical protein
MSVRGEDLRARVSTSTYYLFNPAWTFSMYTWQWLSRVYFGEREEINTSSMTDWYKSVLFTPNTFKIWGIENNHNRWLWLGNTIYIWSAQSMTKQWNWIINYLKIYKKN